MNRYQAESIDMDLADQDAEDKKFRIEELINQRNYWHQRAVKAEKKLAAAPDLLESLKEITRLWQAGETADDNDCALADAQTAIAAAEGRQP